MRRLFYLILAMIVCSGCSAQGKNELIEYGWELEVKDVLIGDLLSKNRIITNYDGSSQVDKQSIQAKENKVFVVLNIAIEKNDSSNQAWKWELLTLKTKNASFQRMEDSFLTLLEYDRLPGTDINFGQFSGWLAFEIPANEKNDLVLIYADEKGDHEIPLE